MKRYGEKGQVSDKTGMEEWAIRSSFWGSRGGTGKRTEKVLEVERWGWGWRAGTGRRKDEKI